MKKCIILTLAILFIVAFAVNHAKASYTYYLSTVIPGSYTPKSALDLSHPWLTVDFTTVSIGKVQLALTSNLSNALEFISEVALNVSNVNPKIEPSDLTFTYLSGPMATSILKTSQDKQKLNGGGNLTKGFDILLTFQTGNGVNRFDGTDITKYNITKTGLVAEDFNFQNTGGANATIGNKIQGINSCEIKDTLYTPVNTPVPISGAAWLLGPGLLSLVGFRKKYLG
ncbi:MAG: hypothetical protein NT010_06425 [Proteobacteria bacterium]|nr:hypothetical protein [Pseudomonadota bacterium]